MKFIVTEKALILIFLIIIALKNTSLGFLKDRGQPVHPIYIISYLGWIATRGIDMFEKKLKVLASAEVAPFSKVGGLADVVGELPPYLEKEGAEVAVFTPLYGCIDEEKWGIKRAPKF